jgi:hypothetical protein
MPVAIPKRTQVYVMVLRHVTAGPFVKGNGFYSGVRMTMTWFYLNSMNVSGRYKGVEMGSRPLMYVSGLE